jgi:hypothetical protein
MGNLIGKSRSVGRNPASARAHAGADSHGITMLLLSRPAIETENNCHCVRKNGDWRFGESRTVIFLGRDPSFTFFSLGTTILAGSSLSCEDTETVSTRTTDPTPQAFLIWSRLTSILPRK